MGFEPTLPELQYLARMDLIPDNREGREVLNLQHRPENFQAAFLPAFTNSN